MRHQTRIRSGLPAQAMPLLLLALGCAAARPPAALPAQAPSEALTEISLERQCFGCTNRYRLTFRSDGSAKRTLLGSAREGTTNLVQSGSFDRAELARLEGLLASNAFFALQDDYRHPRLRDGEMLITTATQGTRSKRVSNANDAGPQSLRAVQEALDALAAKVSWQPLQPER